MGEPVATLYALKKCDIPATLGTNIETSFFFSNLKKPAARKDNIFVSRR